MPYVTYTQYADLYGTPAIDEGTYGAYAGIASDIIDTMTQYRIVEAGGLASLPASLQLLVQKACAAQIMYLVQNGLETVLSGQTGAGFTVGKVHIDGTGANANGMNGAQLMVCPMTRALLEQTGLMQRGTPVAGYRTGWGWPIC